MPLASAMAAVGDAAELADQRLGRSLVAAAAGALVWPPPREMAGELPPRPAERAGPWLRGNVLVLLTAGNDVVVPDSEAILRWAEKTRGANLYPTPRCAEWSQRASDGFLPNAVLYYNWVEPNGYARSMRAKLSSLVPWYVGGGTCIAGYLVDWGVSKKRAEFAASVLPELSKHPDVGTLTDRADAVAKEGVVREALVKELMHFQSGLGTEGGVGYLCGGDSPTAADCSVYAQLERLVGTMGDAKVPASVPGLLDDVRLGAIKKWREMMVEKHPIRYGGKRAPRAEYK